MFTNTICLETHGEFYSIDMEKVCYMQADDHYTHVYYITGLHVLMPCGLSAVEGLIAVKTNMNHYIVRLGRKYIINIRQITRIDIIRSRLYLFTNSPESIVLHIPKSVLRQLKDDISQEISGQDCQEA